MECKIETYKGVYMKLGEGGKYSANYQKSSV